MTTDDSSTPPRGAAAGTGQVPGRPSDVPTGASGSSGRHRPDAPSETSAPPPHTGSTRLGPDPDAPSPTTAAERGPLARDTRHKMVSGVCAGLGRHFDLDPVIFRAVLAVLTLSGGLGLLLYSLCWLLMPVDSGDGRSELQRMLHGRFDMSTGQALLAVMIGAGVFLSFFGNGPGFFPWLLIGLLVGAVAWSRKHRGRDSESAATEEVPREPGAPMPPRAPSWWQREDPFAKGPATGQPGGGPGASGDIPPYIWGPLNFSPEDDAPPNAAPDASAAAGRPTPTPQPMSTPPAPPPPPGPPAPPHLPRRRRSDLPYQRERSLLGKAVALLALIVGVVAALTVNSGSGHRPLHSLEFGMVAALGVLGLGLVAGAWFGRVRTGVMVLAALLTVALAGASALPESIDDSWGERRYAPSTAEQVRPNYRLGGGVLELNLSKVDPKGATISTEVEVAGGGLSVRVPENVKLVIKAEAELGSVRLPDSNRSGFEVTGDNEVQRTIRAKGKSLGTFELHLTVGIGDLVVTRTPAGAPPPHPTPSPRSEAP